MLLHRSQRAAPGGLFLGTNLTSANVGKGGNMPTLVGRKDFDFNLLIQQARLAHLTEQRLDRYLTNQLDDFEQAQATDHLKRCLICDRRVQTVREILALGAEEQAVSLCESFRAQMPGFRQYSDEERAREMPKLLNTDRKSTRLNSSHLGISYAVFCLKK